MFFVSIGGIDENQLESLNKTTRDWELSAARGECEWICADCSCTFNDGMPDECIHGHKQCTDLIIRDKKEAG
jgi:hypothetical protein